MGAVANLTADVAAAVDAMYDGTGANGSRCADAPVWTVDELVGGREEGRMPPESTMLTMLRAFYFQLGTVTVVVIGDITPTSLAKRLSAFGIEEGGGFGLSTVKFELDSFNKAYRVKARDERWAFAIIDQAMMEWLLERKKHTLELASGGITVSTWFTLDQAGVEEQLDFIVGFLDRFPDDLKQARTTASA